MPGHELAEDAFSAHEVDDDDDCRPTARGNCRKGIPPFLTLYVADHPDTSAQAQRLTNVLKDAGIPAKAFGAKETNHNKLNANLGTPDDPATKELFTFVDEALKK